MAAQMASIINAHNALQNALHSVHPAMNHHPLGPPSYTVNPLPCSASTSIPKYDGLTYRSTLCSQPLPQAPPPNSEWSAQSQKCLTFIRQAISKSQDVKAPTASISGVHLPILLEVATKHFKHITNAGPHFTKAIRHYQYSGNAFWIRSHPPVWIPQELAHHFRAISITLAAIRHLANELGQQVQNHRASHHEHEMHKECVQQIIMAVDYIEHYVQPYRPAMEALSARLYNARHQNDLQPDDGDIRGRILKTHLPM